MDFNQALGIPATPPAAVEPPVNTPPTDTITTPPAAPPAADTQTLPPNNQQPAAADAPPATTPPAPDFNSILDKMSDGMIKDENGFMAVLPQLKEYPNLKKANEELTAKLAAAPTFADDEARIFNDLKKSGATKEQLQQFQKINEVGDIKELTPVEARIAKMVLVDGIKPSVAKLKVEKEYKIGDENVDSDDREILDEDLRVAADKDREELTKFKAKVSNVEQVAPEELQLRQQAATTQHEQQIKPYVKDLVTGLPNLGTYAVTTAKDGVDAISFEIPINDSAKAEIGKAVENFFMDGLTPVTKENTIMALSFARADYFQQHAGEIFASIGDKVESLVTERLSQKYERRTPLLPGQDNPINGGTSDAKAQADWMEKKVNKRG